MVNSEELINNAEYLTLQMRCRETHVVITGFDCIFKSCKNGSYQCLCPHKNIMQQDL